MAVAQRDHVEVVLRHICSVSAGVAEADCRLYDKALEGKPLRVSIHPKLDRDSKNLVIELTIVNNVLSRYLVIVSDS